MTERVCMQHSPSTRISYPLTGWHMTRVFYLCIWMCAAVHETATNRFRRYAFSSWRVLSTLSVAGLVAISLNGHERLLIRAISLRTFVVLCLSGEEQRRQSYDRNDIARTKVARLYRVWTNAAIRDESVARHFNNETKCILLYAS